MLAPNTVFPRHHRTRTNKSKRTYGAAPNFYALVVSTTTVYEAFQWIAVHGTVQYSIATSSCRTMTSDDCMKSLTFVRD